MRALSTQPKKLLRCLHCFVAVFEGFFVFDTGPEGPELEG